MSPKLTQRRRKQGMGRAISSIFHHLQPPFTVGWVWLRAALAIQRVSLIRLVFSRAKWKRSENVRDDCFAFWEQVT